MDFFTQIQHKQSTLNQSENKLLRYFLENAANIEGMKIHDVAKTNFFSAAGIVRFCKKLGFSGYSELKNTLVLSVKAGRNLEPQSSHKDVTIFDDIVKTKQLINPSVIHEVIDLIFNATRIDLFGEGSSKSACNEMAKRLQLIGKHPLCYDDSSIMYLSASTLRKSDLVFAVSMSGETAQVLKAVNIARAQGATIASITNMSMNSLAAVSDISMYVCSTTLNTDLIKFTSRIPALILMEYIFYKYNEKYSIKS